MLGKGLKLPIFSWGIIQEVQNRPSGDIGITRVVGSTAPVYDVTRMDDWEDINAKDALVSLTNLQMAIRFHSPRSQVWDDSKHSATNGQTRDSALS